MIACTATTKKGAPCRAPAVAGTDPPTCISHSPKDVQGKLGFGGPQPGSGRPRLPSPTEVARGIIEEHVVQVLRPYFRSIGLDLEAGAPGERPTVVELERGAVHVGKDPFGGVHVTTVEDLGAQIVAAEKLLDRVFGKPKQTQEVTGAGGEPLGAGGGATLIVPADADAVARLLQQTGALDATRAQREDR